MRGILFIEPLYHATVAGKKTQTRRSGGLEYINEHPDEWEAPVWVEEKITKNRTMSLVEFMRHGDRSTVFQHAPRYKVGEVLYIKEPHVMIKMSGIGKDQLHPVYAYGSPESIRSKLKFKNKLFMPADKARAFIRITGIKCERLLDISDEDCIAEGIQPVTAQGPGLITGYKNYLHKPVEGILGLLADSPKDSFISLYKFANKVKEVPNLWVWAYTFEYLPNYKIA